MISDKNFDKEICYLKEGINYFNFFCKQMKIEKSILQYLENVREKTISQKNSDIQHIHKYYERFCEFNEYLNKLNSGDFDKSDLLLKFSCHKLPTTQLINMKCQINLLEDTAKQLAQNLIKISRLDEHILYIRNRIGVKL